MSDCNSGAINNVSKGIITFGAVSGGWVFSLATILFNLLISIIYFISFYYFIYICFGDDDSPGTVI